MWLNKAIDEGPYVFKNYIPPESQTPRMQTNFFLIGDDLKHYEVEIKAMNLVLIAILNEIYNSVDACTTAKAMWERVERLMRGTMQNKVDRKTRFIVDYDDDYQGDAFQKKIKDTLTSTIMLLARAITQRYSNLTNNLLRTSSNTINQAIIMMLGTHRELFKLRLQDLLQIYNATIVVRNFITRNCSKPRVRDSKYFMEHMLVAKHDEAGVTLTDKQNDFLVADSTRMEDIEELSVNICLMARIQPANINSDAGPSYDSAFLSEVQRPSTSYVNTLFAKDNQKQKYPKQPKIINNTIGGDQIDSNIIFNEPNVDVNSGSVEYDNNVQASYALEKLALNAYKEAEKQQINATKVKQQNQSFNSTASVL
nr:hypothetical protein [Tanacetum cinerariifolium]